MKRIVSVGMALALAVALATDSTAAGPPQDFVTGAGHHSEPDTQFTISAHSGPAGEDPRGNFSFKIEDQSRRRAEVTCLIVVDNEAVATGTIVFPESDAGDRVVMHAVDGGEPAPGQTAGPDLLRFSFEPFIVEGSPPGCFFPVFPPVPVTKGNIVVHDATP
jgi:hypothetical protein